jgi:hypothetical protein
LCLGLHGDDLNGPEYLEFEVGVTRDGHELDITWLPQDDIVWPGEVGYFKSKCFGVVVACISEGD